MTPAGRLQAAIDLVDQVIEAARAGGAAADTLIARYFATRRYAGSKDRRAVRALVYAAIRRAGELPASGRAALLGLAEEDDALAGLFDGSAHGPAPIMPGEPIAPAGVAPRWLAEQLAHELGADELAALLERAPLDLRANRLKTTREAMLAAFAEAVPGRIARDALRLPEGSAVEGSDAFRSGLVEVQDEGSQLLAEAVEARSGMTIVDLCAGAGGKTLALAADMAMRGVGGGGGGGRLIACDVDRARLGRLAPRAARAGAIGIETRLLDPGSEASALTDLAGMADAVLVDAPCSGTGTWRRNPEARWRLTPARLERLVALQDHVLALAAPLVRPGGALVYAVCSLLPEEGASHIDGMIARGEWTAAPLPFGRARGAGRLLTPASDGTDGFFVARLIRSC